MTPKDLAARLRAAPAIRGKCDIARATAALGLSAASPGLPGDDAAVIPRSPGEGFDLLAGEGFIPGFVKDDPWFAGWCGVMVNLSDIAAMGGRSVALIDQVWACGPEEARPLLAGLRAAAEAYGVPLVGGHTNFGAAELGLAVSVMGRATAPILSTTARPGDTLILAADHRGSYRNFDNFCAALEAPAERLRADLDLLPDAAEAGLIAAGKDVSQGGVAGTAVMLAESSGVGLELDLLAIAPPEGVPLERWMKSFPSYGFLLTASADNAPALIDRFRARDIDAAAIGGVVPGSGITFRDGPDSALFWDHAADTYLGLSAKEPAHA